jgi:hypothetical protein
MGSLYLAGAALAAVSLIAGAAQAVPYLPVTNFDFSSFSGSSPKNSFTSVNPTGWHFTNAGDNGPLVFVDGPNTATSFSGGYGVWTMANPPTGGNFIQADGNPDYDGVFYQTISGLTVGQTYELDFYQAAGQQFNFNGATTEQWIVSLGTHAIDYTTVGVNHYFNTDLNADIETTHLMNTPSHGSSAWEKVTLFLTADATTDILSFLAWGDGGSTANMPPTVFLAGINPTSVPEPMTLSLFGAGIAGAVILRRRASKKQTKA